MSIRPNALEDVLSLVRHRGAYGAELPQHLIENRVSIWLGMLVLVKAGQRLYEVVPAGNELPNGFCEYLGRSHAVRQRQAAAQFCDGRHEVFSCGVWGWAAFPRCPWEVEVLCG